MPLLTIVGFSGAVALAYFLLDLEISTLMIVGLCGASLVMMFALPYYFDSTLIIFNKYHKNYYK